MTVFFNIKSSNTSANRKPLTGEIIKTDTGGFLTATLTEARSLSSQQIEQAVFFPLLQTHARYERYVGQ